MSFSTKAKEELTKAMPRRQCCKTVQLGALVQTAGSIQISKGEIKARMVTETNAVARYAISLAKNLYNLESEIFIKEKNKLGKIRNFEIILFGASIQPMLVGTGVLKKSSSGLEFGVGMPAEFESNDCCRRSFLKGAFLGSSSISDPNKGYHLEFVSSSGEFAEYLCKQLNLFELNAKVVIRNSINVVYLKESDKISDFLAIIGANSAILDLQNIRALKDFRNNVNRQVNCETANIAKTISASVRQIDSIRLLINNIGIEKLPENLREIALLRINNPESTLEELSSMLDSPLGKSGVNHRLRKLETLANQFKSF